MENIRKNINDLFDSGLKGEKLQAAIEREIEKISPYDHDDDNPMDACGIESNIEVKVIGQGSISNIVQRLERSMTKRKLAYVLFRRIVEAQMSEEDAEKMTGSSRHSGKSSRTGSDLESTIRGLMGYGSSSRHASSEKNPNNCDETDNSECWKCKYTNNCKRKDNF